MASERAKPPPSSKMTPQGNFFSTAKIKQKIICCKRKLYLGIKKGCLKMNENPFFYLKKKCKNSQKLLLIDDSYSFLMKIFAKLVHLCQHILQNINDSLRGKTNFLAQFLLLSFISSSNLRENEQFHFVPTWTSEARHCPINVIQDVLVLRCQL